MSSPEGYPGLFDFPERSRLGRVVPKSRIFAASRVGRRVRDQFTRQVAKIIWQYKLAPETLNLKATRSVPEIQVFTLLLKSEGVTNDPPEDILRCIDRAIGFPIIFELISNADQDGTEHRVRVVAAYKRPNEAEAGKWVIGDYFDTDWLAAATPRSPLPVALDLARLYENMLRQLIPLASREGESIADLAERQRQLAAQQREYRQLEVRLQRERQFNRKVELNRQLREIKQKLEGLSR